MTGFGVGRTSDSREHLERNFGPRLGHKPKTFFKPGSDEEVTQRDPILA